MKNIKIKAINEQKKIIANLRVSGTESAREKEIDKLNLMLDDYENLLHCLNKNNGLIRDWGELKHINKELDNKFVIIVENIEDAQSLLIPYHNQFDFILSYDSYAKCDCCQKIVNIEDTTIIDNEDIICSDCLDNELVL